MTHYSDLEKMSVTNLRTRIKQHNIRGYSKMNKRQLIDAIATKEGITKPKKVGIKPTGLRRVNPKGAIKTSQVKKVVIKPTGLRRARPKGAIKLKETLPAYEAPPGYYPRGAPPGYDAAPGYFPRTDLPAYSLEPGVNRISASLAVSSEKMDNVAVSEASETVQQMNLFTQPSQMIQMRELWGKERYDSNVQGRIKAILEYQKELTDMRQNAINNGWFTAKEWTKLINKLNKLIKTYEHQLTLPDIHRPPKTLTGVKLPESVKKKLDKLMKTYREARAKEDDDDPDSIITASRTFREWIDYDKYVLDKYGK